MTSDSLPPRFAPSLYSGLLALLLVVLLFAGPWAQASGTVELAEPSAVSALSPEATAADEVATGGPNLGLAAGVRLLAVAAFRRLWADAA